MADRSVDSVLADMGRILYVEHSRTEETPQEIKRKLKDYIAQLEAEREQYWKVQQARARALGVHNIPLPGQRSSENRIGNSPIEPYSPYDDSLELRYGLPNSKGTENGPSTMYGGIRRTRRNRRRSRCRKN